MNTLEIAWRTFAEKPRCGLIKAALFPLSSFLNLIARIRNKAYDLKFLKSFKPEGITVISIGNLTVGGTGKTPLTILIAKELEKTGKGAILSRGYRRKSSRPFHINQQNLHHYNPERTGDEPYLMAKSTQSTVIVNKNRELGLKKAEALGFRWALLDDGFQRRQTARDLDIVVVGPNLFGNGLCFPAGPLREPPSSLKRADLVVLIESSKNTHRCEEFLKRYTKAPLIKAKWIPQMLISQNESIAFKENEAVGLFSGIGNPSLFIETAQEASLLIKRTLICGDHKVPKAQRLTEFWSLCQNVGCQKLICTEKDYVKLPPSLKETLPIYYLSAELKITEGDSIFKNCLNTLYQEFTID